MENIVPQDTPQKQCAKCGNNFPATSEYFHRNKNRKDGIESECKTCKNIRIKEHRKHIEIRTDLPPEKQCSQCHRTFARTKEFFTTSNTTRDGLSYTCRICDRERTASYRNTPYAHEQRIASRSRQNNYNRIYYWRHHEEQINRKRNWRNSTQGKEHEITYGKIRRALPEYQQQMRTYNKSYNQRPEVKIRQRIYCLNRIARTKDAQGTHTQEQIQEQLKRQKYRCYYCSTKFTKKDGQYIYHVDHIIPLSRGGSNDISNLVASCPRCNLTKHAKLLHEWPEGGRLL